MKAEVRTVREIRNASAIAKRMGVSRVTLWRVVNGKTRNPKVAKQLKRYGITVAK